MGPDNHSHSRRNVRLVWLPAVWRCLVTGKEYHRGHLSLTATETSRQFSSMFGLPRNIGQASTSSIASSTVIAAIWSIACT